MIKAILVVCVGNICRSAIGERLLASMLADSLTPVTVRSAGLSAVVGHPADPTAAEVATDYGLSLDGHVARQFSPAHGHASELILVMETDQKRWIASTSPELTGKIMLFDHWTGASGIADPFKKPRKYHMNTYKKLEAAAIAWAHKLQSSGVTRD